MRCSKCGFENPSGMKFCGQCTTPLALVCPNCHFENPPGFKFCGQCTTALGSDSAKPRLSNSPTLIPQPDSPPALEGERKTVTALFADIKGSMELMEDLDPEEARAIIDPALKLMMDAVHRYDGYIVQSTGDGIFALFGAPVAHEDHPQRALYAALRLQETIRTYSAKLVADGGTPLETRVGINTGEVVVRTLTTADGHTEYTPIGHTANLASRMQVIAPTGSIAITEHTRHQVEGYFQLKPRGPTRVKGLSEPVDVYEVTGLGPLRTRLQRAVLRGLTKFVGREREIEALKHAAELARAGHGQVVAAMAEPGVGKSRLFHEFKLISQSEWITLEAFSVSHGKATAYLPVIDLLHEYFAIERGDDMRRRREKVAGKVVMLDRSLEDTLPYLFALLGLSEGGDQLAQTGPEVRRRRMHEAIRRILQRESLNQPLMLIFEDLHWIDGETQGLLDLLVDSLATARILLLVNYRPEYRHEWGGRTYYAQLRLDPLGRENAEEMLDALLSTSAALLSKPLARSALSFSRNDGGRGEVRVAGEGKGEGSPLGEGADLATLKRFIIERTEGNPFFMEETVQALVDDGALVSNGAMHLMKPVAELKIPSTVQAILAARMDRLPAAEKELLQTLAVIGREPSLELIKQVTAKSEGQLDPGLSNLQKGEFIYEQPSVEGTAYIFKHALTQQVAYNSLLAERRRNIHERAARAIEAIYASQVADHYTDLAHHYLQSSDALKAVRYTHLAAEQAVDRGAYPEAATMIKAALKLLEQLPEESELLRSEFALRSIQIIVQRALYGMASLENEPVIHRMCELGEKIGGREELLRALIALSFFYFIRGEANRGLEVARRCVSLADSVQDARLRADAHLRVGLVALACGKLREAVTHLEDAMRHSAEANPSLSTFGFSLKTSSLTTLARTQQLLGHSGEAIKLAEQALRQARQSTRLHELGLALSAEAMLHCYRREPEIVRLRTEEAITLSEQNGLAEWLHLGRFRHGWSLAELGQLEHGIAEMEAGIAGFRQMGGTTDQQYAIALLACSYARIGRIVKALEILDECLVRIELTGEKVAHSEILRLRGELLLMRDAGAIEEAEICFRSALDVACAQEAKWWELRTSVSLARLLRDTNRRDEARKILAEIYNWFTEGFDLPDLQEARALLDKLSC